MNGVLKIVLTTSFAFSVFRVTTPILFSTLGACIADKAGMTNIGLDGIMLTAALAGVLGSSITHSPWLGLIFALAAGSLMGALLAYASISLKAELMLSGISLNLIASAATALLLFIVSGDRSVSTSIKSYVLPNVNLPFIKNIPILGEILSGHNVLTYISIISVFLIHVFIKKTILGIRIRSIGENEKSPLSTGINVIRYKYMALILSGLLAGFGGAFLSMGYVSFFATDMTAGRGFIAVAASAMGSANPIPAFFAALLFGIANALANSVPTGFLPQDFINMIPYVVTIIGLTIRAALLKKKKVIE